VSSKTATENTLATAPPQPADKPRTVLYAERALWVWAGWNAVYGIYEACFAGASDLQPMIDMLAPVYPVTPQALRPLTAAIYAVAALSIVWLAVKIGRRRRWARVSILANFVLQALWVSGSTGLADILSNVPDLGLQAAALWFLYTQPARGWFARRS
jgi:hypothetical protein